jgi:hypothetical protein
VAVQVVDDVKGPITRKDFEVVTVPAGDEAWGGPALDHIGRPLQQLEADQAGAKGAAATASASTSSTGSGSAGSSGSSSGVARRPLIGNPPAMKDREQICESLFTGVKVRGSPWAGGPQAPSCAPGSCSAGAAQGWAARARKGVRVCRGAPCPSRPPRPPRARPPPPWRQGLDLLTPFGRGASLLVIGPNGSAKSRLAMDVIGAQVGGPVDPLTVDR